MARLSKSRNYPKSVIFLIYEPYVKVENFFRDVVYKEIKYKSHYEENLYKLYPLFFVIV